MWHRSSLAYWTHCSATLFGGVLDLWQDFNSWAASVRLSPTMVRKHTAMQSKLERTDSIFATLNPFKRFFIFVFLEPWDVSPTHSWTNVAADCSRSTLGAVKLIFFIIYLHILAL